MQKVIYRLTHPGQWHMRWKPSGFDTDLSIDAPAVIWEGERLPARRWAELENAAHGGNSILCAAGPSLATLTGFLERQQEGDWIAGVNGAIRLRDREPVCFDLFVMTDVNMAHLQWDNLVEAFETSRRVIISPRLAHAICERDSSILKRAPFWLVQQPHEPYGRRRASLRKLKRMEQDGMLVTGWKHWRFTGFSRDPHFGFFAGGTVTVAAIQTLAYAGARRIAITGMDLCGGTHFYTESDVKESRLKGDYETRIEPALISAAKAANQDGFELLNLSQRSRLPERIIPKASPNTIGLREQDTD